jgi:hypothetical protein
MKKIFLLLLLTFSFLLSGLAQKADVAIATTLVNKYSTEIGLSQKNLEMLMVFSTYILYKLTKAYRCVIK